MLQFAWLVGSIQRAPRSAAGGHMVATGRPRWFIDRVDIDEGDRRWLWRCVDVSGRLSTLSPTRFKTFLDAYADAKRNGMDTHDFVPERRSVPRNAASR